MDNTDQRNKESQGPNLDKFKDRTVEKGVKFDDITVEKEAKSVTVIERPDKKMEQQTSMEVPDSPADNSKLLLEGKKQPEQPEHEFVCCGLFG